MPRLSDEEDSSDSDSDTSSIRSIPDDASSNAKENHPIMVGEAYSTEYFVTGGSHVSGKLVDNRSKRKLRSHSNDDRATKVQRLGSPDLGLTQDELDALNRQDSADSNYETAEDDEDDEEEGEEEEQLLESKPGKTPSEVARLEPIPPHPAVPRTSIRTHPAWPQPKSSGVQSQPQPQLDNSNPKVITAYELMRKKLPHLRVAKEDVPWKIRFLINLPAKRVPIMTGSFNTNKPQNTVSYLAQATGELLPKEEACEMCRTSRGVYDGCVVSRDPVLNESFRGVCARCWYSRQGCKCSLRKDFLDKPPPVVPEKPKQEPSQSNTPVPVPQVPSVPYKQLQKESQLLQQKRAFPEPGQIRTITRESRTSTPTQNGNSNVNGTTSVRKETPVFPPKPNSIPVRRDSLAQTGPSPPARPALVVPRESAFEATTKTTSSSNGVATRTRSGTGASTGHQNHFAGLPVELPNFVTQIQQFNNQERSRKEGGSGSASDSMGDRIDKWTKKYEGMAVQQLLSAHKQLVEQNAEHNARMAAMMAVLIKKVDQVVGQPDGAENGA